MGPAMALASNAPTRSEGTSAAACQGIHWWQATQKVVKVRHLTKALCVTPSATLQPNIPSWAEKASDETELPACLPHARCRCRQTPMGVRASQHLVLMSPSPTTPATTLLPLRRATHVPVMMATSGMVSPLHVKVRGRQWLNSNSAACTKRDMVLRLWRSSGPWLACTTPS